MNQFLSEGARGDRPQIRFAEIIDYLDRPSFQRNKDELPDITPEEREWLSHRIREIYFNAKKELDKDKRLKLMERFYDALTLLLCDPMERKASYIPPDVVESAVFQNMDDYLTFGTATTGERIYFKTYSGTERASGRYMRYPVPTTSATELGREYFSRFKQAFGTNEVNLDQLVLEDL